MYEALKPCGAVASPDLREGSARYERPLSGVPREPPGRANAAAGVPSRLWGR